MDVYLDNNCVFSGEMSVPAPDEDAPGSSELPPALSVPLVAVSVSGASPASLPTAAVSASASPAKERRMPGPAAQRIEQQSDQDSDPPSRPPRPLESRSTSNLWDRETDQDQDVEREKPRPRRGGRPSRRDRGGLQSVAETEYSEGEAAEDLGRGSAAAAGEREQRVRQSLEAIQQAERFNLGRLRKGSRMACPELTAGADSLAAAVGLDPTRPSFVADRDRDREDDILDDSLEQTASSMEPVAEKGSVSSGEEASGLDAGAPGAAQTPRDTETRTSTSTRSGSVAAASVATQRQQQQRSHRIEKVQATIQNTIADLNDIMSSLAIAKPNARDKDPKPASVAKGRHFPATATATATSFPSGRLLVLEILSTWGDRHA